MLLRPKTPREATQSEAEGGALDKLRMSPLRTQQLITALLASQAEAEAGVNNAHLMTPLRTAQAIAALAGGGGAYVFVDSVTGDYATVAAAVAAGETRMIISSNITETVQVDFVNTNDYDIVLMRNKTWTLADVAGGPLDLNTGARVTVRSQSDAWGVNPGVNMPVIAWAPSLASRFMWAASGAWRIAGINIQHTGTADDCGLASNGAGVTQYCYLDYCRVTLPNQARCLLYGATSVIGIAVDHCSIIGGGANTTGLFYQDISDAVPFEVTDNYIDLSSGVESDGSYLISATSSVLYRSRSKFRGNYISDAGGGAGDVDFRYGGRLIEDNYLGWDGVVSLYSQSSVMRNTEMSGGGAGLSLLISAGSVRVELPYTGFISAVDLNGSHGSTICGTREASIGAPSNWSGDNNSVQNLVISGALAITGNIAVLEDCDTDNVTLTGTSAFESRNCDFGTVTLSGDTGTGMSFNRASSVTMSATTVGINIVGQRGGGVITLDAAATGAIVACNATIAGAAAGVQQSANY